MDTTFVVPAEFLDATISHGTLNAEHLSRRYVDFLEVVGHPQAVAIRDEFTAVLARRDLDDLEEFLVELEWVLSDSAPDGYMFNCLEGDGSDFGYWPIEFDEFDT